MLALSNICTHKHEMHDTFARQFEVFCFGVYGYLILHTFEGPFEVPCFGVYEYLTLHAFVGPFGACLAFMDIVQYT